MTYRIKVPNPSRFKVKWFVYFIFFFSLFYRFFCDILGLPSAIRYFSDVCLMVLLFFYGKEKSKTGAVSRKFISYTVLFCVYALITYFFNFQSPIYFVYGLLLRVRYYLFAILCIEYLNRADVRFMLEKLDSLFYVNTFVAFVQIFVFGLYGDNLGGLFGYYSGCNGYLNVFLILCVSITLCKYLNKEEKIRQLIVKTLIAFFIAAVAELKVFFLEFIVVVIFAVLFSGFTWKKLLIIAASAVGLVGGFIVFSSVYSYASSFLKLDAWITISTSGGYSAGYGGTGEVNRLTFVPVINRLFLCNGFLQAIGLGTGNCSFSGIDILNTPFYQKYGYTRYEWFTSSYIYLEMGWIGMLLYLGFFVLIFVLAQKQKKTGSNLALCYLSQMTAILAMVLFLYNNSLTLESGFLVYFLMISPFITKEKGYKEVKKR